MQLPFSASHAATRLKNLRVNRRVLVKPRHVYRVRQQNDPPNSRTGHRMVPLARSTLISIKNWS